MRTLREAARDMVSTLVSNPRRGTSALRRTVATQRGPTARSKIFLTQQCALAAVTGNEWQVRDNERYGEYLHWTFAGPYAETTRVRLYEEGGGGVRSRSLAGRASAQAQVLLPRKNRRATDELLAQSQHKTCETTRAGTEHFVGEAGGRPCNSACDQEGIVRVVGVRWRRSRPCANPTGVDVARTGMA